MASRSASGTDTKPASSSSRSSGGAAPRRVWESRAVLRLIEAGSTAECPHCQERVKFRARHRDQQVICNVYIEGVWDRVEQYHEDCYVEAGNPYGEATKK